MRLSVGDQRPSTSDDSLVSKNSRQEQSHPAIRHGSRTEFSQDISSLLLDIPLPEDFVETHTTVFDEDITTPEDDTVMLFIKDYFNPIIIFMSVISHPISLMEAFYF